jgi:gamma-glutamylcyclotransferase (GGCT)/AIG2-like uncharacterized protein YtfP
MSKDHNVEEMYYFAYGSNMNDEQMAFRCPGAEKIGYGVLEGYRIVERLYADIEKCNEQKVDGLVWILTKDHLSSLDKYEGYNANPRRYDRHNVSVLVDGKTYDCIAYEMIDECKKERNGKPYPEDYRKRCRKGAIDNGIPSAF